MINDNWTMTNTECTQWYDWIYVWIKQVVCSFFCLLLLLLFVIVEANNFIYKQLKMETHNFIFDSSNMSNVLNAGQKVECLFCYLCHRNKNSVHCKKLINFGELKKYLHVMRLRCCPSATCVDNIRKHTLRCVNQNWRIKTSQLRK